MTDVCTAVESETAIEGGLRSAPQPGASPGLRVDGGSGTLDRYRRARPTRTIDRGACRELCDEEHWAEVETRGHDGLRPAHPESGTASGSASCASAGAMRPCCG